MKISFQVQMTKEAMFDFLLYHTYSHASGIIGIILGIGTAVLAVLNAVHGTLYNAAVFGVLTFIFLIFTPVSLRTKASAQVKSDMFSKPLDYEMSEEGIRLTQGEESYLNTWDSFQKVRETKGVLLLYLSKARALVIPKESMGTHYAEAVKLIETHMPEARVKLKKVIG